MTDKEYSMLKKRIDEQDRALVGLAEVLLKMQNRIDTNQQNASLAATTLHLVTNTMMEKFRVLKEYVDKRL